MDEVEEWNWAKDYSEVVNGVFFNSPIEKTHCRYTYTDVNKGEYEFVGF